MTFARLTRGDWLALVAALALLLVMSLDWYSTEGAEEAKRAADSADTRGPLSGEPGRQAREDAEIIEGRREKNAWQADPFADRIVLFALLAAVALALVAAWLRAAGKRFEPPWTPSALATVAGLAAAILLAARIIQKPEVEAGAVVKLGAPLGLVCVGLLAIGARFGWNAERDGSVWAERPEADADRRGDRDTGEREALWRPAALFDHEGSRPPGATAVATPPAQTEPQEDEVAQPPPEQEQLSAADPTAWAPEWDDPAAAERERRRAERGQRREGGSPEKPRRRWPFGR